MQSHRILLIEPPFYRLYKKTYSLLRYPLSLGYLSGSIRTKTNWQVMVYNADFSFRREKFIKVSYLAGEGFRNYLRNLRDLSKPIWKEIKATILEYGPDVVGISAKSQNFVSACMVAKLVKEISKDIVVVVGGPHVSLIGQGILECLDIDIGVIGEGENTIVELLTAFERKADLKDINGIV